MSIVNIQIDAGKAQAALNQLAKNLTDTAPFFREISEILASETEWNFESQGRPKWLPLSDSTKKSKLRRNNGSSVMKILQDRGLLAKSITPSYTADYAMGSTNVPYAAIQHYGGTIEHPAAQRKVRLATKKDGSLARQRGNPNLLVFARSGRNARESTHASKAYSVTIPARPFMPFKGGGHDATLQPEAEESIYRLVQRMLSQST